MPNNTAGKGEDVHSLDFIFNKYSLGGAILEPPQYYWQRVKEAMKEFAYASKPPNSEQDTGKGKDPRMNPVYNNGWCDGFRHCEETTVASWKEMCADKQERLEKTTKEWLNMNDQLVALKSQPSSLYSEEQMDKRCLEFGIWLQEDTTYTSDSANGKYLEYHEKAIGYDRYTEVSNEKIIAEFKEYLNSKQS